MTAFVCLLVGLGLGYFAGTHPTLVETKAAAFVAWIKSEPWKKKG